MEEKHILKNTIIFLISFIGFLGGILIPILGSTIFWMNKIDSRIYFVSFIFFALLNLTAIILMKNIPKEEKLIRYSFFLSFVGLCINGFLILSGLPGALY
jgi:cytochrome c biogenesis factor